MDVAHASAISYANDVTFSIALLLQQLASGFPVIHRNRVPPGTHDFPIRQPDIAALIARKPRIFCSAIVPRFHPIQFEKEILMSASTSTTSSASAYTTPAFWERLWRTAGIQSALCFIVAYIVYGHQPQVGASADALAAFYDGERMRILIAAVFYGLAVLNLMWFAAAIKTTLADAGQDGWGRRRRPPQVPPWVLFSSCSPGWSQASHTPREITSSHRA
jgi:hypothetical protein